MSCQSQQDGDGGLVVRAQDALVGVLPDAVLEDRFDGSPGRGWVRAKTGTLTGVNSLAGTVLDAEGRILVFALLSNGPNPVSVRPRLDALAAGLRSCGCH